MYITENIKYIGVNDHKIDLFEGQYKVPHGISYNSYIIIDQKIAILDSVDIEFTQEWLNNIEKELDGRKPDYLIVSHMEPDHSANIMNLINKYPTITIVGNKKTFIMMSQFFRLPDNINKYEVNNGDELQLGQHTLKFIFAPMVHWPEVMFSYELKEKILFSADAFGKFGANDIQQDWDDEARRYYIGIVGKYGVQVQAILKKAKDLDIHKICPLHGPILKDNLNHYISLYDKWSSYQYEKEGVVIAYTSVYGNTKQAVDLLAETLKQNGCQNVIVHDLARCDMSQAVSDAFMYSHLVLATITYNADIFPFMKDYINHLLERNYQNRTISLIENGSWAPMANKIMKSMFDKSKNITYTQNNITLLSSLNDNNKQSIQLLAKELF